MSVLDQMKLLTLGFILILTSKGQEWKISVHTHFNTTLGSNLTIDCTFTTPKQNPTDDVQVYWKKFGKNINIKNLDKNPFIYHPNHTFVSETYRHRTQLIGDQTKGSCSLLILNIKENESKLYVRVAANKDNYSFKKNYVSIFVSGANETKPSDPETQIYWAISVPVSIVVIVILIGIFCFVKHKRTHSFTREESGYYANFSRASSNQAKSEATSIKNEKTQLPQPKAIDEPVYVNTEDATGHMDQSMDLTENIYVNIVYSK